MKIGVKMGLNRKALFCLVLVLLLLDVPAHLSAEPARTPRSLLCNDVGSVAIDAGQFTMLRKVEMRGNHVTSWIEYGVSLDALKRDPTVNLSNDWSLGYRLDDGPVTSLKIFTVTSDITVALSFVGLKATSHRLAIGLINSHGQLTQENTYCFSTPGRFVLTARQHR